MIFKKKVVKDKKNKNKKKKKKHHHHHHHHKNLKIYPITTINKENSDELIYNLIKPYKLIVNYQKEY